MDSSDAFSDQFDPNAEELDQNKPGFNFGANLETHDSVSSLEHVGRDESAQEPPDEGSGDTAETTPLANGGAKENGDSVKPEKQGRRVMKTGWTGSR